MTQDQYGEVRGPGYVVRDDAVPENETEEFPTGETKPMTRFQKVASALRGGGTEHDEIEHDEEEQPVAEQAATDAPAASPPWVTQQDEAAMATSPVSRETPPHGDYWEEPGADRANRDDVAAVTSPDVPVTQAGPDAADHSATEPDMFGTTTHAGNGTAPSPEEQAGAATIADAPVSDVPASDASVSDASVSDAPSPAAETTGRHAAGTPGDSELRPGEATGTLGDFSDLTYGNLIPDAAHYTEQWQQIQFRFVDDPQGSVTEAADVVAQVTAKMEAAIQERQRAIEDRQHAIAEQQRSLRGRWGEGANADTEALRETLRMYKTFLDQLIGPRAS
jgi:hypothetical protein